MCCILVTSDTIGYIPIRLMATLKKVVVKVVETQLAMDSYWYYVWGMVMHMVCSL